MPISFRTYMVIAVFMAAFAFLMSTLFGDDMAQWAVERQIEAASKSQPVIEQMVFQPLEFIMARDTRVIGAIMAGLVWPAVILMMLMIVLSLVLLSFIDANRVVTGDLGWLPDVSYWMNL